MMVRFLKGIAILFLLLIGSLETPAGGGEVKPGDAAPQFALASDSGARMSLGSFAGKSNVVLVFYRGYW